MPNQPKRPSSRQGKPTNRKTTVGKSSPRSRMGKSPQSRKRTVAGDKFSHRPYKPRKPKAKKPRSADSILKEARAARKSLIRKASRRPTAKAASRVFVPILKDAGNAPIIASGHGQYDARPEVWAADDFYVIVEAEPECAVPFARAQVGFRYLMSASCFYRESRSPHSGARHHPIAIFTLEHSHMLPHSDPGFFDRLLGEEAKPISMIVGAFIGDIRLNLDSVIFDDNFTNGRRRLLSLVREHVGISPYFDFSGYLNRGETLPVMK